MSVVSTHYILIGEKISRAEALIRFGNMEENWEVWNDSGKVVVVNAYNGNEYIAVKEKLREDEEDMGYVDLSTLLEKYKPEEIHIFTQWS